jgi:hypothetical protein
LSGSESLILASAVATVMAAMTVIGWTSTGRRRHTGSGIPQSVGVAAATLAVGLTGRFSVPVLLIATLAGLCAVQLVLSLRARTSTLAIIVVMSAVLRQSRAPSRGRHHAAT